MGAGHDHGSGCESIGVGNIQDHMKPRPKWNIATLLSLFPRTLAFFGCIAHGIVSFLGMNEILGTMFGQEFFIGNAPLGVTVVGVLVAFVCGGESLFLETPNSQRVFKSLAEIVDNWFNDKKKELPWYFWFLYTPLFFIGGGLIAELIQRKLSRNADALSKESENYQKYLSDKLAFITKTKTANYFPLLPDWTWEDVDLFFIVTVIVTGIPHLTLRALAWTAWHGVLKHSINIWYPLVGFYGEESLPIWYLLIQPIVEPVALFFGALAGASEFWMGISAFMVFLAQSGVPQLIDLATGGLLSAGMGVLIVLFSVAYSNNLFLNGRRAISSMREMARGEISLRKKRNDDRLILRKPHVHADHEHDNGEKHASHAHTLTLDIELPNTHGHSHSNPTSANSSDKYNEQLGLPIYLRTKMGTKADYKNADEAIICSVKRGKYGDRRVDSPIYLVEGKPLLNKDGTLFSITTGDIVHLRIDEDGEQILCDHNGYPFLMDGKPLPFHQVRTATYRDGSPLIDSKGYPVLDAEGDLIFIKNRLAFEIDNFDSPKPITDEEQVIWQEYEVSDSEEEVSDFTAYKKGYWEYSLTKYAGVFALMIGIVVAIGVGLLGVNTLFAALGVSPNATMALSILAAVGYGMQNACLQGTESFTLLKYIGQGIDEFNTKVIYEGLRLLRVSKKTHPSTWVNVRNWIGIRLVGLLYLLGESLLDSIVSAFAYLVPDVLKKAYYLATGTGSQQWRQRSWLYFFAKPFFSFAKLLVSVVGPIAHGGEAFRGVYVGFPIIIGLIVGGVAIAQPWVMPLILAFAIAGALVMGLQNRSLEVKTAHDALDAGLEAIDEGRFFNGIVAPEVLRIPQRLRDFGTWVYNKWKGSEEKQSANDENWFINEKGNKQIYLDNAVKDGITYIPIANINDADLLDAQPKEAQAVIAVRDSIQAAEAKIVLENQEIQNSNFNLSTIAAARTLLREGKKELNLATKELEIVTKKAKIDALHREDDEHESENNAKSLSEEKTLDIETTLNPLVKMPGSKLFVPSKTEFVSRAWINTQKEREELVERFKHRVSPAA